MNIPKPASGNSSAIIKSWKSLPVVLRAILTGVFVAAAGTVPWAFLAYLNINYLPSIPWSVIPASLYLWLFWRYVRGKGWPRSTAELRRLNLRANRLNSETWGAAIFAGLMGLVTLVILFGLLNRLISLPQQDVSELKQAPFFTSFCWLLMGSIFAGVVEESGFRGYMQGPIERRHGPVIAILLTGLIFGLVHFTHRETTLALLPFYMAVGTIYGLMAYLTNSILPGLVLHAAGDIVGGLQVWMTGQSEWQTSPVPKPLVWDTGPDAGFWISFAAVMLFGGLTIWAYRALASTVRKTTGE